MESEDDVDIQVLSGRSERRIELYMSSHLINLKLSDLKVDLLARVFKVSRRTSAICVPVCSVACMFVY